MYGMGMIKGLGVTLKHFVETYVDDLRWIGRGRYYNEDALKIRQGTEARGVFTVQYPEEKLSVPESVALLKILMQLDRLGI